MDSALPYLIGLIAVALPSRFIFYRTSPPNSRNRHRAWR